MKGSVQQNLNLMDLDVSELQFESSIYLTLTTTIVISGLQIELSFFRSSS